MSNAQSLSLTPPQARGALLGALVGDATGVPYEFRSARDLPAREQLQMIPPDHFVVTYEDVPRGTWSDDGAQILALIETLRLASPLSTGLLAQNLLDWRDHGRYTPDGHVFDIGVQTRKALDAISRGVPADASGPADERSNGNGALMRCIACVLVPFDSPQDLIERAMRQGLPTHGHIRSQIVCALYALVAWNLTRLSLYESLDRAIDSVRLWLYAHRGDDGLIELELVLGARGSPRTGSGYVVDSFWSAWWAVVTSTSYRECIQGAISLGNDTDTTACIAGGLAGLLHGEEGIPAEWLERLNGRERALALLETGEWK